MTSQVLEAQQVWEWLQWQLPPAVLFQAQAALAGPMPTPTDPVLAAGLAAILNPATLPAVRLQLLIDMLTTIRNAALSKP